MQKTLLLTVMLCIFQTTQWRTIACGIANMGGIVFKAPHRLNIGTPATIKINAFGNGSFWVGVVPIIPKTREQAMEMLDRSDCRSAHNVTDVIDLTCELEPGQHYFLLLNSSDSPATKIAYEVLTP